ncbi:SE1832 family protein [Staphylococcus saprophyticus]|nr:SE1832 family protein [Staphylococcus saprophyticus]
MDLNEKLAELKYDYVRLQDDLEKRESVNQQVDPLVKQLEEIEKEIASVRSEISQKEHK